MNSYCLRAVEADDVEDIYQLRCMWAQETDPPPKQLDRWGPGLPVYVPRPEETDDVRWVWSDADAPQSTVQELTPTEPSQAMRRALAGMITNERTGGMVATYRDNIVGFATFVVWLHPAAPGAVGEIELLYVRPEFRRGGLGRSLVEAVLNELRRRRVHVFRVHYERDDRRAARFWSALGWSPDGYSNLFD